MGALSALLSLQLTAQTQGPYNTRLEQLIVVSIQPLACL